MQLGDWSMRLKDDCPMEIRRLFEDGANVYVTPNRFADGTPAIATLRATALWAGLVTRNGNELREPGGVGLLGYLQTGRGHAGVNGTHGALPAAYPATFAEILDSWDAYANGLTIGTGYSPTGTTIASAPDAYTYLPPFKPPLDTYAKQTGNDYKVNPDGTLDYGAATALFRSTPTVTVAPGLVGRDTNSILLNVVEWRARYDLDNLRTNGSATTSDQTGSVVAATSSTKAVSFRKFGSTVANVGLFSEWTASDSTSTAAADTLSQALADETPDRHWDITCSVLEYAIGTFLTCGDWIWVYSPKDDLWNAANQITIGGQTILPMIMRVVGYTWPVQDGMGIAVNYDGTTTDVTEFVVMETDQPTKLELDTSPQRLNGASTVSPVR